MDPSAPAILLLTDLAPRCDRATRRAIALAELFGGDALAATAVEPGDGIVDELQARDAPAWYRPVAPALRAEWQLRDALSAAPGWRIDVAEDAARTQLPRWLALAGGEPLVVSGPVRTGVAGPTVLGSTLDALLRRERMAVLVVRAPVQAHWRRILVASDFSAPCRAALLRARALFPDAQLTVLHGFEVPRLGLMDVAREQAVADAAARQREEGNAFLRDAGLADAGIDLVVEHGDPARLLQQYLETHGRHLLVLGTHGRGAMHQLVVGSVARSILTRVDEDALVVRG